MFIRRRWKSKRCRKIFNSGRECDLLFFSRGYLCLSLRVDSRRNGAVAGVGEPFDADDNSAADLEDRIRRIYNLLKTVQTEAYENVRKKSNESINIYCVIRRLKLLGNCDLLLLDKATVLTVRHSEEK